MKTKLLQVSMLACVCATLVGCMSYSYGPEPEGKLYVRTLIDGKDTLYIRKNTMWFQHEAYNYPGEWSGQSLPTYINGDQEWDIEWNSVVSDVVVFEDPKSKLPTSGEWNEDTMKVSMYTSSVGVPSVREYPSAENDYTLVLELDDIGAKGAHWYSLDIDWDETAEQ